MRGIFSGAVLLFGLLLAACGGDEQAHDGGAGGAGATGGGATGGGGQGGIGGACEVPGTSDGGAPTASSALTAAWANDGSDKVTRDELRASNGADVTNSLWDGTTLRLFAAKNEVVAANVVLESADAGVGDVSVSFADVADGCGDHISGASATGDGVFSWVGRHIELFYVRYLPIKGLSRLSYDTYDERHVPARLRRPFTGEGYGAGTWADRPDHDKDYPDIAVPLELVPSFAVTAGTNQSVWIDIYVPKDARAGIYAGSIEIREGGELTRRLPVELTVRGFALPDEPASKTMIVFGDDIDLRYTGQAYPTAGTPEAADAALVRQRHFLLAHRHKLSLVGDDADSSQDHPGDGWLEALDGTLFTPQNGYDGPGSAMGNGVYSIGTYSSWGWKGDGESGMHAHADGWVSWFAQQAPGTEYFLYLLDESIDYAQMEQWSQWIDSNAGPGASLPSFATMWLPTALANVPALDISASWMGVGITSEWDAAVVQAKAAGKRVFLYNGLRPAGGTFATEDDGVALRVLPWAQYKKGIDRWFFWQSTYYDNFQGGTGQTNVFESAQTFGGVSGDDPVLGETGWNYSNGDGVLFYPGTDTVFPAESYGVRGPFASLRVKQWRRGIQDVDYLVLAAAKDALRVQQIVSERVPKVLWEYGVSDVDDPTWVRSDISWSIDPDAWEAARAELAEIIAGP